jgi:hypothetical protein
MSRGELNMAEKHEILRKIRLAQGLAESFTRAEGSLHEDMCNRLFDAARGAAASFMAP